MEELNFTPTRGIHKTTLLELAGGGYIQNHRNIILTGATGYIAQALEDPEYLSEYAYFMRLKERDSVAFEKILNWGG